MTLPEHTIMNNSVNIMLDAFAFVQKRESYKINMGTLIMMIFFHTSFKEEVIKRRIIQHAAYFFKTSCRHFNIIIQRNPHIVLTKLALTSILATGIYIFFLKKKTKNYNRYFIFYKVFKKRF